MPDIDPAALGRSDSNVASSSTPSIAAKALPGAASSAQKGGKSAQSTPRLDIELVYAALKTAVGEHWGPYKEAISRFVLGYHSQEELCRLTDHFIAVDAYREHLHNQLLVGIYANLWRDAPEQLVAGWVSANYKPVIVSKPPSGDAAEHRLKVEVMQLPPRIRHRLKGIQDDPFNPLTHSLVTHNQAKRIQPSGGTGPLTLPGTPSTATGLGKDLEIRKRYALLLASETHDLPHLASLTDRLVPICYEEGLPSGPSSPGPCADLLLTGLEAFIKEAVTSILGRTRTDAPVSGPEFTSVTSGAPNSGPSVMNVSSAVGLSSVGPATGIRTAAYKRRLEIEEAAFARGEVKRSELGLLPCEVAASHRMGMQGDLRITWDMGEPWLAGLMPWLGERAVLGDYPYTTFDQEGVDEDVMMAIDDLSDGRDVNGLDFKINGVDRAMVNGDAGTHHDDPMSTDEPEWGWQGAGSKERAALGSLLDDCLAIGH